MSQHHKINYIEIPVKALASSKAFFNQVFGWEFVDYGDDYAAIIGAGIDGGLYVSEHNVSADKGSVLVVLYSNDLVKSQGVFAKDELPQESRLGGIEEGMPVPHCLPENGALIPMAG